MPTKAKRIIGWTLTVLVGLFLIGASGVPKFLDISKIPAMADMMTKLQIPLNLLKTLGVIEISVAVLCLIPRTAFLGAILTRLTTRSCIVEASSRTEPASVRVVPLLSRRGRADRPNFGPCRAHRRASHMSQHDASRCCSPQSTVHTRANRRH